MTKNSEDTLTLDEDLDVPRNIWEMLVPSLKVGGLSGMSGVFIGGISGVMRSTSPTLFALASGIQWFALGSSFWMTRSTVLRYREPERRTAENMVSASAMAGAMSGVVGGALRGPRNIIPGAIMFAIFGAAGQSIYNKADARQLAASTTPKTGNGWLDSKWSPVKVLTDEEYERMLQEKLLKVNVEIALVDDNIQRVKDEATTAQQNRIESPQDEN